MLNQVFATKLKMSQGWTTTGKRVAITRCRVESNLVVAEVKSPETDSKKIFEIGYGTKKAKNMSKPLRTKLEKSGFSNGILGLQGVHHEGEDVKVGDSINLEQVLEVGDIVKVQGTSKGRGFGGVMKRHGFKGVGGRTHGQSDRQRAPGSIGSGTTPGRVLKGLRMAGHYGVETISISNLTVLHIDSVNQEVWLSGPVPGSFNSIVRIEKMGKKKNIVLDKKASGIKEAPVAVEKAEASEVASEAQTN
ncbi:50S ribosomal protein L3 [Patescibacteria group bacterium]|nr:50S ribosomal protein L3 [Patescibacteria group bacterium]